jgi:electron transfer flavoprotein alpha subunit
MSGVLVVAEHRRGSLSEITSELITAGLELRSQGAGEVTVVVVGANAEQLATESAGEGVSEVVAVSTSNAEFEPHVTQRAIEDLAAELQPEVVLVGHTVDGFGFAPALAARNGFGFAPNVRSVEWRDGELRARRGVYGDRLVAELAFDHSPVVVAIRPGEYAASPSGTAPTRSLVSEAPALATHLGYREVEAGGIDITNSEFLLSIGRGIGEEENVERFSQLADKLGATLSASRPLVDAGWVASARQVGQSGQTVKPQIYLALGISGAAQHLAGIREAETVIAVNTDPAAPIFNVAKYGAVVDIFDLAEELESRVSR